MIMAIKRIIIAITMVIIMCPQKASRTDRAPASRYPMGGCGDLLKYLGATEIPIKRAAGSLSLPTIRLEPMPLNYNKTVRKALPVIKTSTFDA